MNSNPHPQPPTSLHSMIPLLSRACKITVSMCAAALLGLASSGFAQGISNFGVTAPTPGANDQSSLTGDADSGAGFIDNQRPGQSFTVGANSLGYRLDGLYIKTRSTGAGGGQPQLTTYNIRVYSMTNSQAGNATLLTQYVMTNQVTFVQGNWLRVTGLTNLLAANGIYAVSINRNGGGGWWTPGGDATQPYANGRAGNYPTAAVATPSYVNYDLAFDVNLTAITDPLVGDTTITPANPVYAGTAVTLSATFGGTAPFTSFAWQSDGGTAGVTWANLPSSTTNTYSLDTTSMTPGTYQYRLAVTGGAGTITNVSASLVLNAASVPTGTVAITPSSTFAGNVVTLTSSLVGTLPISGYQWQFSDLATFTNNIAGANSATYTISDATVANTGSYRLVANNTVGPGSSSFAALTVTNSSAAVQILNLGATTPLASGFDIAQLSSAGNQKFPSGLNYYDNNAATAAPGQSFTTGTNDNGYLLSSLYIKWGDIEGSHAAAGTYTLCIYSVSGTAVTLLQTYTNQNSAAAMVAGQWTKWIGLSNVLAPNAVYAYSIRNPQNFMQVGNATNNPYTGGMVGLFPSADGTANFGNSADDATFLIHLASAPLSAPTIQSVNIAPANSPANPLYLGTPVTLSAVAIGTSPRFYQWQTDNGSGGVTFSDISGGTSNPYILNTSSLTPGTQYQYRVIVTNAIAPGATSSIVTLDLNNASGPLLVTGATITPSVVIVGNNAQMTASFIGSLPITYQWKHAGTNVPGATSNSFAITGAQFTDAGVYSLVASNNPPGIGPTTANSTAAPLYVVNPPQTNSVNAKFSDGGTSPIVGAYDVSQLLYEETTVNPPNLNYFVDQNTAPGQTFTTLNTPPTVAGYPLNYVYVKHDTLGGGTGWSTAQSYTLRVYEMLDGTNAALLTSYVTTNLGALTTAGDWARVEGLTNMLQINTTYAFALKETTPSSWWKLAAHVSAGDDYAGGLAVSLPPLGGRAILSYPDTNFGFYYDAAFVAGMTPASAPVELAAMIINPSTIHTGQGPVVMTASFTGSQPITYQWQHEGTNLPGATATTYTIPVASAAVQGTYVCLASNVYSLGTPTPSTAQYLTVDPTVQTGLINPTTRNGSFELVSGVQGTGKVNISSGRVDNWTTWTNFTNSGDTGAQASGAATDGTRDAFLQGDSGIYNIAGQIIAAGDVYSYTWDWVLAGRGTATVQLGYWNGSSVVLIPGTDSTAPGGTGVLLALGTNYTVMPGDPAIGHPVVLTVNAPSGSNYPEVDNVILTVVPAGSAIAPFVVSDTTITPARSFVGGTVLMSATFNGTAPISYQWNFDNGGGAVPIAGATNSTYTIASVALTDSGAYYLTATNAYAPYTASSSPKSLLVFSTPQANTTGAGILDATSVAPSAGPNDIAQLVTASPTTVPGINYYVDSGNPPGQTFTTLGAFTNGYQLRSIYMQEELTSAGGGGLNPGTYRLGIYAISDTNAVLLTSYDSTNQPTLIDGNWIQWVGLTNVLATNQTYAFSMHKQSGGGWWKLANNATATDLYSGGRAASLPGSGLGALAFSTDTTIDAGFLIGLSAVSTVSTTPPTITRVVSGNNLTLSWPTDHTGWRLQVQTNAISIGLQGNWVDVAGSTSVNTMNFTIDPANGSVFYRMVYP
jgi:hypothetical protein